jgi:LuxR family maltose regulon positive regulatory protein
LCEAVTGREDSQAVLDTLERENLFLIPLDQERCWYRFHDLFSSLLQRQLRSQAPRTLVDLHQRASEWNEKAGFTGEAIRHALEAEDKDRASALLEHNSRTMSVRGEHVSFMNWVRLLGPAAYKRPWLCIAQAGALMITGQLEDAAPWLDRVREALNGESSYASVGDHSLMNRDIFGYLDAYQAYMACVHNEPDTAVQLCLRAIQDLSKTDRTMQGWVRVYLGNARLIGGDPAKAEAAWKEAARMAKNTGSLETAVTALDSLAYLDMLNGKLRHAAEICQEGIQIARFSEEQSLTIAAPAYARLAAIQYEWNEIESALHNAENALELSRALARPNYLIQSFLILARLRLLQQDLHRASSLLQEAEQIAGQYSLPLTADSLLAEFQLRLYLARGDPRSAGELAGKRKLEIESKFNHMRESEYLLYVRILLAEGKAQAALEMLEWCLDQFKALGWQGGVIELLILKAKAQEKTGHKQEACASLEQALAIAEPEGYLRSFIEEGEAVKGLLQQVLIGPGIRPQLASYASELLSVFEQSSRKPHMEEGIIEPLTEREAEVMKYIANGLSNQEIAGCLYLSPNTLKAHTQNIFAKLNVHNRLQAVNKARKLKLID